MNIHPSNPPKRAGIVQSHCQDRGRAEEQDLAKSCRFRMSRQIERGATQADADKNPMIAGTSGKDHARHRIWRYCANYLRAKRSKSAIWRSISSRAESEAERTPWMRRRNSSGLEERERASSRVMSCLV